MMIVVAVWLGLIRDPLLRPLMATLLTLSGLVLGVVAAAMALGFLGHGLFMGGERMIAWIRRGATWPEE